VTTASDIQGSAGGEGPSEQPPQRGLSITRAGLIGTFLLLLVVALCVRLGFWQLARHEARQERNALVASRIDTPPLPALTAAMDTSGIFYRTASVSGEFDAGRSVVLPGRSHRGIPGVHLLTPLRLAGTGEVLMVNRGWVPSPDAATIDVAEFPAPGTVSVTGLVLPFPGSDQSLSQRPERGTRDAGFRQVWYVVDEGALRAQYPYPMMPVMLQALPEPGAAPAGRGSYPARLDPPPLDPGPHFGYALQWFGFALIGLIGWLVLVLRGRVPSGGSAAPPLIPERPGV
jgi:surfeit locus 1 family protein